MPILPRISNGNLVMPLHTLALSYGVYALIGLLVFGTGLRKMTEFIMIPDEALLLTVLIIIGVAIGTYLTLYLVAFQERRADELNLKKKALEAGVPVDDIALERVKTFHNIYLVAMLLGAAVSAAVAYVALITVVPTSIDMPSAYDYYVWAGVVTAVASLFIDRYFCHPIADGQFKTKVVEPLLDAAIGKFLEDSKDTGASALTDEQKQKFLDFISKL